MIIRYLLVLSICTLSSCTLSDMNNPPVQTETGSQIQTGTTSTGSTDTRPPLVEDISGSGGAYYLIFDGIQTRTIRVMHQTGASTTVSFVNSEARAVAVTISFPSASWANLRLSQIVMPDGTMDGPFGQKTGYNLRQLWGYEFIFRENMMAGDPWSGEADITFTLLDKAYDVDAVVLP